MIDIPLDQGARILILTEADRAAAWRARYSNATVIIDTASLDGMEGRFDAALLDGLEHAKWDRWVLQQVHRALRSAAPLVLIVPPITSFASVTDVGFLWYALRQFTRRFAQRCGFAFELSDAVRRRYYLPLLVRKLESVGYADIQLGSGWPGANARAWLARHATLTARKAPSSRAFEPRAWAAAKTRWQGEPRALEVGEWREACVLVLSPHPDDELIGCGGTLCRLLSTGARVSIVQATDGAELESLRHLPPAQKKVTRLEEAQRVAAALGAHLILWRQQDAGLRCSPENVAWLSNLLVELQPTHVFTPFLQDGHADHRALSRILAKALANVRVEPQVLQYEVWGLVAANMYCDVSDQAEALERLLCLYERAMRVDNFVHFCGSRNRARAQALSGGAEYVEAFHSTSSAEFQRLAQPEPSRRRTSDARRWTVTARSVAQHVFRPEWRQFRLPMATKKSRQPPVSR